ncbi:MAG: transglutaminase family protein [Paracoccaceae bacterium]
MLLNIAHSTHYSYATPQKRIVQSYRLLPSLCANQKVVAWNVSVGEATLSEPFTEGNGDRILTMTATGPVSALTIEVTGQVETQDLAGVLKDHREMTNPLAYLRETPLTRPDATMRARAAALAASHAGGTQLDLAHALAAMTNAAIAYLPGSSHAGDSAASAWAAGKGVCQDQAQALIALARVCGLPARYVIGYLFADADGNSHEASHAWAELHVSGLGWVGFDVANACCPDDRYIRLGSGLDAADGAPIRGIAFGAGAEGMEINLSVTADQ